MAIPPKSKELLDYTPLTEWNAALAKDKLLQLYTGVLGLTDDTISWYQANRSKKGKAARRLRVSAIILFIITTLVPYISAVLGNSLNLLYIGYLIAGLAGGLLAYDRYYGLTNSYIRFVLTGSQLENMHNAFIQNWQVIYLNNTPLTKQRFANLVNVLLKYQEAFNDTVKTETEQWAKENQQNLKSLTSAIQQQSDQLNSEIATIKAQQKTEQLKSEEENVTDNVPIRVIQEAIAQNYDTWKQRFNINAVGPGKKVIEQSNEVTDINCLIFSLIEKIKPGDQHFVMIPDSIRFTSSDGHTYNIPTDIRSDGSQIFASANVPKLLCDKEPVKRPGCSISRDIVPDSSGTLGLKVYRGKTSYLLSCYHVLCGPELNQNITEFKPISAQGSTVIVSPSLQDQQIISTATVELGRVVEGYFDNQLDCAIALLEDTNSLSEIFCTAINPPDNPLTITEDHAAARYPVTSIGRTTGKVSGSIQEAATSCSINYRINNRWEEVTFNGVIKTNQFTEGGDSGAVVFDEENYVIGIIIANSLRYTYILPIQRILSKLSITLKATL